MPTLYFRSVKATPYNYSEQVVIGIMAYNKLTKGFSFQF